MAESPPPSFVSAVTPPASMDAPALWFLFQDDQLIHAVRNSQVELPRAVDPGELDLPVARRQYLGYLHAPAGDPVHCFAGELAPTAALPPGYAVAGLRQLFDGLDATLFALAGRAVQIVNWDRTHQFCGRCGTPAEAMAHERAKRCPACELTSYPRLSPAIIIAVTRRTEDGERLLLARNHRFPTGRYSVVAGFVEPGESLEQCCLREVREEVGIAIQNIRYFGSQPWPFPNSLMIGFTAEYAGGEFRLEQEEIADAGWFSPHDLPKLPPKVSIARRLIDAFLAANGVDPTSVQDW
jgi:NAD+ diphosphatase